MPQGFFPALGIQLRSPPTLRLPGSRLRWLVQKQSIAPLSPCPGHCAELAADTSPAADLWWDLGRVIWFAASLLLPGSA